MQALLTPPPLLAASFLRPPFARLHSPFTFSPRCRHARCTPSRPPRPPLAQTSVARPPQPHDPECTRLSPGPGPRAVFFPPYFPHPPGAAAGAPTLGQGLGSAQARGCTGRARGAGSAWASGGRGGGGSCCVFQAPRAAAATRTRGGGRGEGIKGAGVPPSRPPFLHQPPHTVKGPDGQASPLAGIICPPERKYVPHPPLSRSPSSVPLGPAAHLRVRAKCRAEARSPGPAPGSGRPAVPRTPRLPVRAFPPVVRAAGLSSPGRRRHLLQWWCHSG